MDTEIINKQLRAIAPLLKIQHRTYDGVKKQANNTGNSSKTLYNWMRRYREEGIAGLAPKNYKSGRKSKPLTPIFDKLVNNAVKEYLFSGEITKVKTLYEKLRISAPRKGISNNTFTYDHLCKRIRFERKKIDGLNFILKI